MVQVKFFQANSLSELESKVNLWLAKNPKIKNVYVNLHTQEGISKYADIQYEEESL